MSENLEYRLNHLAFKMLFRMCLVQPFRSCLAPSAYTGSVCSIVRRCHGFSTKTWARACRGARASSRLYTGGVQISTISGLNLSLSPRISQCSSSRRHFSAGVAKTKLPHPERQDFLRAAGQSNRNRLSEPTSRRSEILDVIHFDGLISRANASARLSLHIFLDSESRLYAARESRLPHPAPSWNGT